MKNITKYMLLAAIPGNLFMSASYAPVQDIKDVPRLLEVSQDGFLIANTIPASIMPTRYDRVSIVREIHVTSTGYNSEVAQTDDSPFIAADGTRVFDGMVAANFLPFNTKIKIPDYYGDKVFFVHDRMAKRFSNRVDIWFAEKSDAIQWGKRTVRIEILGS